MKLFCAILLLATWVGPLWILLTDHIDFRADYRTANRQSANIAPLPETAPEAIVQVYTARAFNWRGLFASHNWIATKLPHASHYTVYQIIGWRLLRGLSALDISQDIPDRYWFNQKPDIILDIRGAAAEKLIPEIDQAAKAYPYPDLYNTWPGPNSNTFIAFIARAIPAMKLVVPANAIGKDYLPHNQFFAKAASGTGYQFSFYGLFGITIAREEGLEINLLGLVYGISPRYFALDLPGIGRIGLRRA